MIFKFLILCFAVPFSIKFADWIFEMLKLLFKVPPKEKSLERMLCDGDLTTGVSFPEQYILLSAIDENGEPVHIEALDDDFDIVDIEMYKRRILEEQRSSEIQLEI